ncbi:hypothetical protein EI94DRAFT_1245558 [Lactarius quietus]|nr:hypothetical protein EI94DRAFT_1245558 [Lactarius quietus]
MLEQYLSSPQCNPGSPLIQSGTQSIASKDETNSQGQCAHRSLWGQCYLEISCQETPSDTLPMTKPCILVWQQSGEALVDTPSILSQRQVTEAPPPLTADSFEGSPGQLGDIPSDQIHNGYNQVRKLVAAWYTTVLRLMDVGLRNGGLAPGEPMFSCVSLVLMHLLAPRTQIKYHGWAKWIQTRES